MCGIAGIVNFSGPIEHCFQDAVKNMCSSMAYRGPDGEGFEVLNSAILGHRRLAIIDLSFAGKQPMTNENKTIWLTYNGEIYNHKALKAELIKEGHCFKSRTDTEVILHGYEEWGIDRLLLRLRGMFAFGLLDTNKHVLWLIRDHLGIKPLFYISDNNKIIFSSEIHPLYRYITPLPERINHEALDFYLAFGYVPPTISMIRGIEKVPPASGICFSNTGVETRKYWKLEEPKATATHDFITQEIEDNLNKAVSVRLESDVPIGCFLSGGIDSGLVAAMASRNSKEPIKTITVGFRSESMGSDERDLARLTAKHYQTKHAELLIDDDEAYSLPHLLSHVGEPFDDPSLQLTAAVSKAARKTVKVVLTGDGGDDFWGGYQRVFATFLGDRLKGIIGAPATNLLSHLATYGRSISQIRRAETVLSRGITSLIDLYAEKDTVFGWQERSNLYKQCWLGQSQVNGAREIVEQQANIYSHLSKAEAYLRLDIGLKLPGRYLVKTDIASNSASIECRSPFLDQDLVQVAARIPIAQKFIGCRQKGLLKELSCKYLPPSVIRARKRGFAPHLDAWLRRRNSSILTQIRAFHLGTNDAPFRQDVLETILTKYRSGNPIYAAQVWNLVCLEIWWRIFIENNKPDTVLN